MINYVSYDSDYEKLPLVNCKILKVLLPPAVNALYTIILYRLPTKKYCDFSITIFV